MPSLRVERLEKQIENRYQAIIEDAIHLGILAEDQRTIFLGFLPVYRRNDFRVSSQIAPISEKLEHVSGSVVQHLPVIFSTFQETGHQQKPTDNKSTCQGASALQSSTADLNVTNENSCRNAINIKKKKYFLMVKEIENESHATHLKRGDVKNSVLCKGNVNDPLKKEKIKVVGVELYFFLHLYTDYRVVNAKCQGSFAENNTDTRSSKIDAEFEKCVSNIQSYEVRSIFDSEENHAQDFETNKKSQSKILRKPLVKSFARQSENSENFPSRIIWNHLKNNTMENNPTEKCAKYFSNRNSEIDIRCNNSVDDIKENKIKNCGNRLVSNRLLSQNERKTPSSKSLEFIQGITAGLNITAEQLHQGSDTLFRDTDNFHDFKKPTMKTEQDENFEEELYLKNACYLLHSSGSKYLFSNKRVPILESMLYDETENSIDYVHNGPETDLVPTTQRSLKTTKGNKEKYSDSDIREDLCSRVASKSPFFIKCPILQFMANNGDVQNIVFSDGLFVSNKSSDNEVYRRRKLTKSRKKNGHCNKRARSVKDSFLRDSHFHIKSLESPANSKYLPVIRKLPRFRLMTSDENESNFGDDQSVFELSKTCVSGISRPHCSKIIVRNSISKVRPKPTEVEVLGTDLSLYSSSSESSVESGHLFTKGMFPKLKSMPNDDDVTNFDYGHASFSNSIIQSSPPFVLRSLQKFPIKCKHGENDSSTSTNNDSSSVDESESCT